MKISHLSVWDSGTGAGHAAYRIHQGLLKIGIDSRMIVGWKGTADATVTGPLNAIDQAWTRLAWSLDRAPLSLFNFPSEPFRSLGLVGSRPSRKLKRLDPDVIQLHWVSSGFMTIREIGQLREKPVVWRLADTWAFSGAEHYLGDSRRFEGGYLPLRSEKPGQPLDIDRFVWLRKKTAFSEMENLTIVCPSEWLADLARRSALFRDKRVEVISTGHNMDAFKPTPKSLARERLGLPPKTPLALFGAANLNEERKGLSHAIESLESWNALHPRRPFDLVIFGNAPVNCLPRTNLVRCHYLGNLIGPDQLSLAYSVADFFLAPTLEDNLPNTVIEALAIGTPVVGFYVGGVPEIVRHLETGFLAEKHDINGLVEGIRWVTERRSETEDFSTLIRASVQEKFSADRQAAEFAELYRELIQTSARGKY